MTLKQEFIDMLHLIVDPLLAKNEDMICDIEVDTCKSICAKYDGEDVTYVSSYQCEKDMDACAECPYCQTMKVDVSISNYCDIMKNYCFRAKSSIDGVASINNRKQLMKEISELKLEIEDTKNRRAEFGNKYRQYLKYASQFMEKVKEKYVLLFEEVSTEIVPIVFHDDCFYEGKNPDFSRMGSLNVINDSKQNMINIYYCMEDEERAKQSIRHELLHYMLYHAGYKYEDDTAIFHYLCDEYDAHAYKEMPEEENKLYVRLKNALIGYEKAKQITHIKNLDFVATINSMLLYIGMKENCEDVPDMYRKVYESGKEAIKTGEELKDIDVDRFLEEMREKINLLYQPKVKMPINIGLLQ